MNSIMSSVTETHNRLLCQTVLYVPREATESPIDIASKNKELCARLEGIYELLAYCNCIIRIILINDN